MVKAIYHDHQMTVFSHELSPNLTKPIIQIKWVRVAGGKFSEVTSQFVLDVHHQ